MTAPEHPHAPAVAALADDLTQLWRRSKPTALARLDALRAATDGPAGGDWPARLEAATTAAHKLAGSLGIFGLERSSELAGEVDRLVASTGLRRVEDRQQLAALVDRLRGAVEGDR